ncbi:hypothetical protein NHH03_09700 [Stieleria sp. TO1_6]|uniref:hypothetical protein n=1 Tax=Stieleria tagensis TaxID=2956795 RepID=UPI00209ABD25|nr:hypothetical protein [Stieleria tagensis]MCO8122010.1 hypothetical protein [Stieleria tagensis]
MFSIQDILYGGLVPAVVAAAVVLVAFWVLPHSLARRYSAAAALALGLFAGYELLDLGPWLAETHWHWLPYAVLAAAVAGPVACAEGVWLFERPLLYLVVAIGAGWFLVPDWEDLQPSRTSYWIGLSIYLVVLTGLMEPLAVRFKGPLLPAVMWLTMTAAAVVLALSGSMRFAQIGIAAAFALFAIAVVGGWLADRFVVTGGVFAFAMAAVGLLMIGRVNSFSDVPMVSYAIVPAAPLALWLTVAGPLSRLTGAKALAVRIALPLLVLVIAVAIAVVAESGSSDEYASSGNVLMYAKCSV